jgi:NADPH:quinone reductase-like Zn-dependent oxidoreductase
VATDPQFRNGKPFIVRFFNGLMKPNHSIPGDVLVGEIEAIGKDVNLYKAGDQVFAACAMTGGWLSTSACRKTARWRKPSR